MMGMQFAYMMGGAIVVENVFAWNGVGRLAIEAVFARDETDAQKDQQQRCPESEGQSAGHDRRQH
jgi:hypothetical protein